MARESTGGNVAPTRKPGRDERGWEQFPHGADIGICGFGRSLDAAFEEAGKALSAAITTTRIEPATSVEIVCEAKSMELLFVEWLNAVIYEMAERRMVFGEFEVHIRNNRLRGTIRGERVDPLHHQPACEPKGATFTELAVCKDENGIWKARCVIDV
jgi:SHS2 domain-containing protein